ncbi:hypothetical protein CHUUTOTORO_02860 [Serratia phage vB_SmaM-ChuuTotoro]|nr:hypothetical protein CHUUTOTORO_02860 [Serratia phage vB_SmaM-ChuuTotoro]
MAKSDFIEGMMLDCGFECVSAEKHISVSEEYKYVMVNLEFVDTDRRAFKVSSSYVINRGGQLSRQESAKVAAQYLNNGEVINRERICAYREEEFSEELVNAINDINALFEDADLNNKKVYM